MPSEKRQGSREWPVIVDLGIAGWRVPVHSHIACLVETEEQLNKVLGFLTVGLRGSDHCVVAGEAADNRRILGILERQGLNVARFQASGRLKLVGRGPSARAMLDEVTAGVEAALAAGARILRIAGIIGWGRERQAPDEELLTFEALLTERSDHPLAVALSKPCQRAVTLVGHLPQHEL